MNSNPLLFISFLLAMLVGSLDIQAQCNGGDVVGPNGEGRAYTCPGDGNPDIVRFQAVGEAEGPGLKYQFVITNADLEIIGFPEGNQQDFEGAGPGLCYVWGFCYQGEITAQLGDLVFVTQFATGGWAISRNALKVFRDQPDGGTITLRDGTTERTICSQDGYDDPLAFEKVTESSARYRYIITDDDNTILALPSGDNVNLEGTPAGVCRVWGVSFTGKFTAKVGDDLMTTPLSDGCFELSDNNITITRTDVEAGMVSTLAGETYVTVIAGDGEPDVLSFQNTSTSPANFLYIITNLRNEVLGFTTGNSQNFEGAGFGVCRVWGLSYTGELDLEPEDVLFTKAFSSGCFDISDNFITVNRLNPGTPFGGRVMTSDGQTEVFTCPGDGVADIISFVSTGASPDASFTFVVTDARGMILGIPAGDSQNFEGAGIGACLVYGLSYTGNLTAEAGDNINSAVLSDGDFSLSQNQIIVNRDAPEAGTIAMPSGDRRRHICPGDGNSDIVRFVATGASNSKYAYIITTPHKEILGITFNDFQDFENAGTGFCWVWGLAYTGEITAQIGDRLDDVMVTDGCWDLTENVITVIRATPEGGRVSTTEGRKHVFACADDGIPDVFTFRKRGASVSPYAYIITNSRGDILGINTESNSQDFEPAGEGVCRVYGLAYTGNITVEPGENVNVAELTDGCYDLSDNFITVVRDQPEGGMIMTSDRETEVEITVGDGEADIFSFRAQGIANLPYTLIVTDENDNILAVVPGNEVDFEGAGPGLCRVYGVSHTGMITAEGGDNIMEVALSSECYDLSDNYVNFIRTEEGARQLPIAQTRIEQVEDYSRVFPNPAIDLIQVQFTSQLTQGEIVRISVVDMYGRIVIDRAVPAVLGQNQVEMSVQGLSTGRYTLRIQSDAGIQSLPLIKAGR